MSDRPQQTLQLSPPPDERGFTWQKLALLGALYGGILCWYAVWRAERSTDFRDFWRTALEFRQSGEIVSDLGVHNYLPAFTILMTPWSYLPLQIAIVLFNVLSLIAFAATVVLAEKLLIDRLPDKPRPATLIAVTLILPYVHSCLTLGQMGLILLFLCVAGFVLVQQKRPLLGGALLGLATVLKVLPALLLIYLLLRRKVRAFTAGMVVGAVLAVGLPCVFVGWNETISLHSDFYERAVKAGGAWTTLTADVPPKAKYTNNAAPLVLRRLLSPVNADAGPEGRELFVNLADWPRPAIGALYGLLAATVLGLSIWRAARPPPVEAGNMFEGQVFAIWCAALLLLSPLVWTHYFVLMYWPIAYLVNRYEAAGRGAAPRSRWVSFALAAWICAAILLVWPTARAAGAQIGAVAVAWLALTIAPIAMNGKDEETG